MAVTSATGPLATLPGLSNQILTLLFTALALFVLLWGFERYRTTFSRTELGVSVLVAAGLLVVAFAPGVVGAFSDLVNIESRFIFVQILANAIFLLFILYLVAAVSGNQATVGELTRGLTAQQAPEPSAEIADEDSLYVVIPAYNEEDTIGDVLSSLPDRVDGHAVTPVVVSDGSEDRTTEVAREYDAIVVEHPLNQGQGGSLKTGFQIAIRHGADIVVTMDADGQHPADQLPELVDPITADEADYVLGSRYRGEDQSGNSVTRQSGIRVFTWLINRLAKTDITDCTNGYRAIRGSRLPELTLTEERFSAPELIIESRKNDLRIREVPVTIHEREAGETKKPKLGYAVGLMRTIFITWIR
ncbi:glycosyltransferase family 2 protein [Salinibaculum salinum]|uniref:glycosyltransferase family 2 protein n=1 Tax=Salinibaculum salinum TaxID=3131996 RepID=UPI0030ED4EE5